MNDDTHNPLPAILEGIIGGETVQTVDARDLHASLGVGKDFSNWVKGRIGDFAFVEHADFEIYEDLSSPNSASAKSRPQKRVEYALSLDMAKELSMVENNEAGKRVRRYFIAAEKKLRLSREVSVTEITAEARKVIGGIMKTVAHSEINLVLAEAREAQANFTTMLIALAKIVQPAQPILIRHGKTAGQILKANNFRGLKGLSAWLGNRLEKLGCRIEHNGCAEMGMTKARLFDPDKAQQWLDELGGMVTVNQKVMERKGQGKLRLVPEKGIRPDA